MALKGASGMSGAMSEDKLAECLMGMVLAANEIRRQKEAFGDYGDVRNDEVYFMAFEALGLVGLPRTHGNALLLKEAFQSLS